MSIFIWRPRLLSNTGQALLETTLALPLLMTLLMGFFSLLYEQFWTQVIEHTLHEALVCQQTKGEGLCIKKALESSNRHNLMGRVMIDSVSPSEIVAHLKLLGKYQWKTIRIQQNPSFEQAPTKKALP